MSFVSKQSPASESSTQTKSAKANRSRAANLSVLPDDYDERQERFFFVRLTTAIEAMAGASIEQLPLDEIERWAMSLLRECGAAYNGTCGEPIAAHREAEVLRFSTAVNYRTPCDFERLRKPSYAFTVETNDEQVLERSRADLEELKESFRRKEQRRRDPP
ncbi:unnamed protein product [Heligmosomoides polygyrus]|uniref:DUF4054 domain-containing protein n=1 Tax=Heligmosomoides polygyrus TaxID=6339 RepID=A0A183GAD3_HELPZ|nr:unnamed protein product [Heligmosomoides polygyrus]